jgi:hypothetical protein
VTPLSAEVKNAWSQSISGCRWVTQIPGSVSPCEREYVSHAGFHLVKPRSAFAVAFHAKPRSGGCAAVQRAASSHGVTGVMAARLNAETRVHYPHASCDICGGQNGTGARPSPFLLPMINAHRSPGSLYPMGPLIRGARSVCTMRLQFPSCCV